MSSEDFRHIAYGSETRRAERLFRAAVTAFCSLTRPAQRDRDQLVQLTLPLYDRVPAGSRRYVAAALSNLRDAPAELVRRLCDDRLDIAAPLLKRSSVLGDVDLLSIIAAHGLGHARVIGQRESLNPTIVSLIAALEAAAAASDIAPAEDDARDLRAPAPDDEASDTSRVDAVRDRLRFLMLTANDTGASDALPRSDERQAQAVFRKVRRMLNARFGNLDGSGHGAYFGSASYEQVFAVMKSLDLPVHKALLVACAAFPARFEDLSAASGFVEEYQHAPAPAALPRSAGDARVIPLERESFRDTRAAGRPEARSS